MTFIYRISLVLFCLILTSCFSSDDYDEFGRNIAVDVQDAFIFDNQENYVVGDTIFFEQKFSRYVNEEGFDNLLDVYDTTNDEAFEYSFSLDKFSGFSNNYAPVLIDSKYIITSNGNVTPLYYFDGLGIVSELNSTKDAYESRVGVILAEVGKFRLNLDYVYFRNGYDYNKIHLDIQHKFSEGNTIDFDFIVVAQ